MKALRNYFNNFVKKSDRKIGSWAYDNNSKYE